jgi:hypothetical protein
MQIQNEKMLCHLMSLSQNLSLKMSCLRLRRWMKMMMKRRIGLDGGVYVNDVCSSV